MDTWNAAVEALSAIPEKHVASTDQKLKRAQILALLAIGEELARLDRGGEPAR